MNEKKLKIVCNGKDILNYDFEGYNIITKDNRDLVIELTKEKEVMVKDILGLQDYYTLHSEIERNRFNFLVQTEENTITQNIVLARDYSGNLLELNLRDFNIKTDNKFKDYIEEVRKDK